MKVYAYKGTKQELLTASSGGAFSKIVECLVSKMPLGSYSIYGAAWNEINQVEHQRIEDYKEIGKFKGSKYVSSQLGNVFEVIKEDLQNNINVIFSGTPCQVNALLLFLKKNNISHTNLFTIDIICHGTPNPNVLKSFNEWFGLRYKSKVVDINFRDKNISWKRYPTSIRLENGKKISNTYETQLYIRMFFSALIYNRRCFSCKHTNLARPSDLTIGDFWGIEEIMPELYDEKGVSLILSNTKKGQAVLNLIAMDEENGVLEEYLGDLQLILKKQHNLNSPTEKPQLYDEFWKDYTENGFEYCVKKYNFLSKSGRLKFFVKKMLCRISYFESRL